MQAFAYALFHLGISKSFWTKHSKIMMLYLTFIIFCYDIMYYSWASIDLFMARDSSIDGDK